MRTWDPSPWMHTGADWYLHGRARGWLCLIMVYSITALVLSGCGWRNLVGIWQPSPNHGIKFKIWKLNISSLNLTKRINAVHSKQIQHGLELVSHLQKLTENIRVLSKQISSQKNRCPLWKMFMLLNKQQKHILAIKIFYFEILLQYSISCRSWNSAVFHPSSSVVWTSSSQDVTLNAPESLVRGEVPHCTRWDVVRDSARGRNGMGKHRSCSVWWVYTEAIQNLRSGWKDFDYLVKFLKRGISPIPFSRGAHTHFLALRAVYELQGTLQPMTKCHSASDKACATLPLTEKKKKYSKTWYLFDIIETWIFRKNLWSSKTAKLSISLTPLADTTSKQNCLAGIAGGWETARPLGLRGGMGESIWKSTVTNLQLL